MTTRTGQFKIQQISRKGGIRLFGNSWLRPCPDYNPDGIEIKAGRVYRITLDDTTCRVITIRANTQDGMNDRDYLNGLQADEISRLEAVVQAYEDFLRTLDTNTLQELQVYMAEQAGKGRINPDNLQGEISQLERIIEQKQIRREMSQACQTENAGLVAIATGRDSYTGQDGKRYISAGSTESYDALSGLEDSGDSCYHGI